MNLSHFSSNPLDKIASAKQLPRQQFKPNGLWISVDGEYDWPWWTESEQFLVTTGQYHYRIHLHKDANILHLKNNLDILNFHRKFAFEKPYMDLQLYRLDWQKVADEHQGIIIAPYCWNMRLDMEAMWYYLWDCASGCIWDASAVDRIELIREPQEKAA